MDIYIYVCHTHRNRCGLIHNFQGRLDYRFASGVLGHFSNASCVLRELFLASCVLQNFGVCVLGQIFTASCVSQCSCIWRLASGVKIVASGVLVSLKTITTHTHRRRRPRPYIYGVLRLTVLWRLASGVRSQNSGVLRPGFTRNNRV